MGGSPSKKNETEQNNQFYSQGGVPLNQSKERSISLPAHSQQYSTMINYPIQQIVPIKATHNRSSTIGHSQPQQYAFTQKVPNIQKSNQKTVFTDFYDSQSASQMKSIISNLDNSMIEYQSKVPSQLQQDQILDQQNQFSSRLRVTLAGQNQMQQQVPYITQAQLQRSQVATPQKQVPKIIQNSTTGSIDRSSRMSPYQLLRNVVIYDNNTSFNSSNNNNSGNKGITVTSKTNNQNPQTQQFTNVITNRQMHAINTSNQPKILANIPQFQESEQQSTIRTTFSQITPLENIKVGDFLQKNKIPNNHTCQYKDNISSLPSQLECSCLFPLNNNSDILSNNTYNQKINNVPQQQNKQATGNILVVDKNTARLSSAHNTSQLRDESCFNESPEQIKQNTSVSLVNQQRSVDFEQKQSEVKKTQDQLNQESISSSKQNTRQQNQFIQQSSTNRTQIASNQTSSTKQESSSNEFTQKKKQNSKTHNENYLIQMETEKKMKEQQTNLQQSNSQQVSKVNLSSPLANKSQGKNMDDQISLMYSATEDQKKSGNSAFLLMNSGKNIQAKNNYAFISGGNKDQNTFSNTQTVFQNSQFGGNNSKQLIQNQRSNHFLWKQNQTNERQLVVKLEDLYKQMDIQQVSQDHLLQQNQADQQIRIIPHPSEYQPQMQRSFSHVSSLSVFRASNEKLKEDKSCDSQTLLSEKKDVSNKSLINTSVTQLPTISKYYYPITSVKKVTTICKDSMPLYQSIQPYSSNINQRSQSVNQSTQITDSYYQYSSGQKLQRDKYFSVDSQRNGGILLLKDNQHFQAALGNIQQLQPTQICLTEQPMVKVLPFNSYQKNLTISDHQYLPLSQQIPNMQALLPKQQIKIDSKYQMTQKNPIIQQIPNQNIEATQIVSVQQKIEPNYINKKLQIFNQQGITQQIQQTLVKNNQASEMKQDIGSLLNSQRDQNGQYSIIQSCELINNQIREQEFNKEMSNSQISHASISIIPKSIDIQEIPKTQKNVQASQDHFKQQNLQTEHILQKKQFEVNTQKPQQKDLNHSSMDSFVGSSSCANYQSSSCDEYKNVKKDCNNKPRVKDEVKQNSTKNTERTSNIKQEQASSSRQKQFQKQEQQSQPVQVSINLQEQIQNKLQREINLNSINLKSKVPSNDDDKVIQQNVFSIQKEESSKSSQLVNQNQNNYSFQYNSNNFQSVNNNNNTTFDFQLTRTDDEYVQNQLLTVIDEDNQQQHLLKSVPKKKLNPQDKIQIYLNFSSENSEYSSVLSDYNEKQNSFTPFSTKELSFTRQLKNPLVYDKGVQVDQFNKENNTIAGMNINVSLENQIKQGQQKSNSKNYQIQKQNNLPRNKQQSQKISNQNSSRFQKAPIDNSTNEFQINKIIQNELNSATQDSCPSDQNLKLNSKMNELMLLEAQDMCKKTLVTYQNIIDLEDQRKSPKEFDKDYNESLNSNLNPKKRFLTQNDQEEEESLNNYREAQNSMQSQSFNSNCLGGNSSTPFNFSKQQIFSSVNSYNLQNSTILRKVNNQFQALTSISQNNPTDFEKEYLQSQMKNIQDIDDCEIFFKYCKKTGSLVPIPQSKIDELLLEKQQNNTMSNVQQQIQSNTKQFNNSSLNFDQSQTVGQEKRSQSNIPAGKKQNVNFNNLYNNQYLFSKNNSNLYTDVLEKYSGFINRKAREQKSKIQQDYQNQPNSKQSSSTNRSRQKQNLRV